MTQSVFRSKRLFKHSRLTFKLPIPGTESIDERGNNCCEYEEIVLVCQLEEQGYQPVAQKNEAQSIQVTRYEGFLIHPRYMPDKLQPGVIGDAEINELTGKCRLMPTAQSGMRAPEKRFGQYIKVEFGRGQIITWGNLK